MNTNKLGKFLRKLRVDMDETMSDMASKFGVSTAFLSQVESGQKTPPLYFDTRIKNNYELTCEQQEELKYAWFEARNRKAICLDAFSESEREFLVKLASIMYCQPVLHKADENDGRAALLKTVLDNIPESLNIIEEEFDLQGVKQYYEER